jgi:hypothetical protein
MGTGSNAGVSNERELLELLEEQGEITDTLEQSDSFR